MLFFIFCFVCFTCNVKIFPPFSYTCKSLFEELIVVVVANPRQSALPIRVHENHGWGESAASVVTRTGAPEVEN